MHAMISKLLQETPPGLDWITGTSSALILLTLGFVGLVRIWREDRKADAIAMKEMVAEKDRIIAEKDKIITDLGLAYVRFMETKAEIK